MPRDINQRLANLRARRSGTDRLSAVAMDGRSGILAKSFVAESYQKRAKNKSFTEYALGSMQEVDPDYTRISIETAQRVGRQLDQALPATGYPVEFRLQGSVPLNIHIRGVSDVDLLTLSKDFYTYDRRGSSAQAGQYHGTTSRTSLGVLSGIRKHVEETLKEKYPAATVDTRGGKAIKISGGSLARPVDVVPSHWHDTISYQTSKQERDRAVTILDKKTWATIDNFPFLHIALVHERDAESVGGLKKAVRLCKNVKSDTDSDIKLPSFDITSLMYHADQSALTIGCVYELAILAEAQRHLDYLYQNIDYARTLKVPDGSRCILDSTEKITALALLSVELDDLLRQVAKEQNFSLSSQSQPSLQASREAVKSLYLP
jgi:hypothetical protein